MYLTNGYRYFHIIEDYIGDIVSGKGVSEFSIGPKILNSMYLHLSTCSFCKFGYYEISKEEYLSTFSNKVKKLITTLNGECFNGLIGMYLQTESNLIYVKATNDCFDIDISRNIDDVWRGSTAFNSEFLKYLIEGYNYIYHYL